MFAFEYRNRKMQRSDTSTANNGASWLDLWILRIRSPFSLFLSLSRTIHDTISDSIFRISIDNSIVAIFEVWYQMNGEKTIIFFTWYSSFFVDDENFHWFEESVFIMQHFIKIIAQSNNLLGTRRRKKTNQKTLITFLSWVNGLGC